MENTPENVKSTKISISIAGNVFVISLPISLAQLKKLEKYNPESLLLNDEDGNLKFKVCSGTVGNITKNGACFNDATRNEYQMACMTLPLPADVTDAKEYVADYVGQGFLSLMKIMAHLDSAIETIEDSMDKIMGCITFAGQNGLADYSTTTCAEEDV